MSTHNMFLSRNKKISAFFGWHSALSVAMHFHIYLHVCLFVLRFYGLVNPMGSCRAWSVYLTTRLLGRLSPKRLTTIMHTLLPETENCPSWISRRERMTIENISWSISTKECCWPRLGLNPRPPGLQSDSASNWATKAGLFAVLPTEDNGYYIIWAGFTFFLWNGSILSSIRL